MERLGDSFEFGELLIGLLELKGWTVRRHGGFAGASVILEATHPDGFDVKVDGPSVAAAATPLFIACVERNPGVGDEEQLALPV